MRTTKSLVRTVTVAAGVVGAVAAGAPDSRIGRGARRAARRLSRDVRYAATAAPGILYRLSGRRPEPDVPDDVLADRIRSTLGPLEKRLDVPRVHVSVHDHVAVLHGDVGTCHEQRALERATRRVSGVRRVESHLHVGLTTGEHRPSEGRAAVGPSEALGRLCDAARDAGASDPEAATRATLSAFADRLPAATVRQLFGQLPADVRALVAEERSADHAPRLRHVAQLVGAVTAEGGIDADVAEPVTRAVVRVLHDLAGAEARDVAAVLPTELRAFWLGEPVTVT